MIYAVIKYTCKVNTFVCLYLRYLYPAGETIDFNFECCFILETIETSVSLLIEIILIIAQW